jgi:hypothetical protein
MRITNFLIAIAAFCMVTSCGTATPESETKRWESSKKTLATLGAKYPGFKPALEEVMADATIQWTAAGNVADEEKKVEAMRAANSAASPTFVSNLDNMSEELEALKDMATEATQAGGDQADKAALNLAKNQAGLTLNNVEKMLRSRNVSTAAEATAVLDDARQQVKSATNRLQKIMETITGKKAKEKAAADAEKIDADKDKAAEAVAKKPTKCGSCGQMNKPGALKCEHCTAPIES